MPEASVEKILGEHFPHKREIVRMYEYDGYDTSLEIAKTLVNRGRASESSVIIVSGAQAPRGVDALAGAALAGINNNVILLVNANPKIEGVHTEAVDGFLPVQYTPYDSRIAPSCANETHRIHNPQPPGTPSHTEIHDATPIPHQQRMIVVCC